MRKQLWILVPCIALATAATTPDVPKMRLAPEEIKATTFDGGVVGSSGVSGVRTKVLFGDPSKPGLYSMLLFVPMHTTIQAHSHRDNRMSAVLSGEWHFGYGDHFDKQSLKMLVPGSVYTEPGGVNHFASTNNDAVTVEITGYGPTDTKYFDSANDPSAKKGK